MKKLLATVFLLVIGLCQSSTYLFDDTVDSLQIKIGDSETTIMKAQSVASYYITEHEEIIL